MFDSLETSLYNLARAHRILEMMGHGDMTLGHMSLRDPQGHGFWLKRSEIALDEVHECADFILLDFDGKVLQGTGRRHVEWPIHAAILRKRPDVSVVAHTHPLYARLFSATCEPLRPITQDGAYFRKQIPHFKGTSNLIRTLELGRALAESLGDADAVFMKNHGVAFCGPSVAYVTLVGVFLEKACWDQLTLSASGMPWSTPDEAELANSPPIQAVVDNFWAYLNRKLDRAESVAKQSHRENRDIKSV